MLSINISHPSRYYEHLQPYALFDEKTDMDDTTGARKQLGKRLGLRISERRKAIDLTQEQLAERLGVDAETISRFERGVTVPSLMTIERLAGVLKTGVADLLSEASVCPSDQAIQISAWLECLSIDDGEFVITQIKALCDHFSQIRQR